MRNEKQLRRILRIIFIVLFIFNLNPCYIIGNIGNRYFWFIMGPFDLKVTIRVLKNGQCHFSLKKAKWIVESC